MHQTPTCTHPPTHPHARRDHPHQRVRTQRKPPKEEEPEAEERGAGARRPRPPSMEDGGGLDKVRGSWWEWMGQCGGRGSVVQAGWQLTDCVHAGPVRHADTVAPVGDIPRRGSFPSASPVCFCATYTPQAYLREYLDPEAKRARRE